MSKNCIITTVKGKIKGNATSYIEKENEIFIPTSKKFSLVQTRVIAQDKVNKINKEYLSEKFGAVVSLNTSYTDGTGINIHPSQRLVEAYEVKEGNKTIEEVNRLDFFNGDEALLEQEEKENLVTDSNQAVNQVVKPGVQELFESNSEFANKVYEALGVKPANISLNIESFGKSIDNIDIIKDGKKIGYVQISKNNTAKTLTVTGIELKEKGFGKKVYIELQRNYPDFSIKSDKTALSPDAINMWDSLVSKKLAIKEAEKEYTLDTKQALQLYSQYLQQNPNSSVEQFKSWVEEFNKNNQKLNSNIQIFNQNQSANFNSSNLKNDDLALMLFNQALGLNISSISQLTWDNIKDNIFFEKEDGSLGVKNLAFTSGGFLKTSKPTINDFINQKGLFPDYKVFIGESVIYPNVFETLEENEIIKQAIFDNLFNLSGAFEQVKKELNNHSPETFIIETPQGKFTFPKRFAAGFWNIATKVELLLKENQSTYIQDYLTNKRKREEVVKDGKKIKPIITQTLTVNDTIVQNAIGLIGNPIIENAIKNNTSVKIQVFSNAEYSEDGIAGWYLPASNTIYLHESMLNPKHLSEGLPLIAHELIHSVTEQALQFDKNFQKDIQSLLDSVKNQSQIKDFYGFKNTSEFLSEAFSSKEFRELLNTTKFSNTEKISVWQKFINSILRLFGKSVKYTEKTNITNAEQILNNLINQHSYKIGYVKSTISDKLNTNISLSDFISQKSQERLNAIQEIFNQNPELSKIGDVFSYASYLNTIFPDSKVKDIVYHGTRFIFDKFDKSYIGISTLGGKAFYFTKDFKSAERYAWNDMYEDGTSQGHFIMRVILNIKNPSYNSQISDINISLEQGQIENLKQKIEREIQKIGRIDTHGTFFPASLPHSFFIVAFNNDNTAYLKESYIDNKETILIELGNGRKKLDKKTYTREEFLNISQDNVQKILKAELIKAEKLIKDYNEKVTNIPKSITPSYTKENDGVIQYNNKTNEYIVFEPEQIHILSSKADIQGFKEFVQGKQFQKLTAEEKAKTIEQVTREHRSIAALKDLAAKLAWRIGGKVEFENRTDADWKGYNQGMTSVLNEAYMTPDTPFHEILAHPIIRAIKKSKPELYQSLLKELETGRGKEVLEQVKRDYVTKENVNPYKGVYADEITEKYIKDNPESFKTLFLGKYQIYSKTLNTWYIFTNEEGTIKTDLTAKELSEFINKNTDVSGIVDLFDANIGKYTLEEQQEEALNTLLGMLAADKLDAKKDATLISKLKELWKQISDFVRQLLRQDAIIIDELPITTTLNDLAEIMGYGNNKIILPGYKVEYSTPLGNKYDTAEEVNNEIRGLADANVEVDLSGVKISLRKKVQLANEIPVNEFIDEFDNTSFIKKEGKWYNKAYNKIVQDDDIVTIWNSNLSDNYINKGGVEGFIEKNKEYEQSKEIIEQWKKENNIQYDPEEVYSRGQGFYSSIGAYSNLELDLLLKNLIQHIQDNKKAGGEFTISAFTKPIDKRLKHIEGTGDRVRFVIYPKSEHIKWAAPTDVYSGSVWDAHEKVSKDKKSELLGVSFTKAPALRNINEVSPNLADIIDNLSHVHNELGIELTTNNFRIEYDDNIDYSTKKLIDNINKILDQKYGKLVIPKIETKNNLNFRNLNIVYNDMLDKWMFQRGVNGSYINDFEFNTEKEALDFKNKNETFSIQPTQTKDTLKVQIQDIKVDLDGKQGDFVTIELASTMAGMPLENDGYMLNDYSGKYLPKELTEKLYDTYEEADAAWENYQKQNTNKNKEYTEQALINTKIAKLKEIAKKYPRSLITSKVVPINPNMVDNSEIQYSKVGSKQDIEGFKDFVQGKPNNVKLGVKELFNENPELANVGTQEQYSQYLDTIFPDSKVEEMDDNLYISVLNQLEQENIIDKDCNGGGKLKAEKGLQTNFTKGGEWKIYEIFEGKSHKQGGIDINIKNNQISFTNKNGSIKAKYGLVISKDN